MGAILVNTALPTITGTAQVGQTLTASTGTWTNSPTSYAYQWNSNGSPIGGATNSTYVFQTSDLSGYITVTVTAMNSVGVSAPATSLAFGLNISKPVNTAYPYVTGIEQVGQTLMAGNGSWSGNPTSFTYTYQWFNSSTGSIAGQTSSTYVAKVGDLGCYVTVKVTATNAAGSNTSSSWNMSQISAAGATVPIIGVAPAISSAAQYVGQALTVSNGTWANSPTSYTYQWFASGTAITGATTNSYTPVAANLGMLLTVNVNVLPDVEEFGLKVAVTPVGRLDAEKLTVPVKPRTGMMVIVDVPVFPRAMLRLLGDAERLKFGPRFTVRAIVVVCVRPPDVPVIVTVKLPVDAVLLAVSVSVLVLVVLLGLNDGLTPLGRPEADKLTLPPKPLCGLTVIVLVPLVPWVIVTLLGDAERLKFCWPTAFTVKLTVVV